MAKTKWVRSAPGVLAVALISIAAAFADKKREKEARFDPGTATSYSSRQTNEKVTVAAVAYSTAELAHSAFGKLDPNQYGVLPVLIIIQNDTDEALRLTNLAAEYVGADRSRVDATPASDVVYLGQSPQRPRPNMGSPIPPSWTKK